MSPGLATRPRIRRIGVLGQPRYTSLGEWYSRVLEFAAANDLEIAFEAELWGPEDEAPELPVESLRSLDLLLTMGGDGTLLRGARLVAPYGVPVLGINLGHLGFLTAIGPSELEKGLRALAAGELAFDERMVLEARAESTDGQLHGSFLALNDVVLHRGGVARMIRMAIYAHEEQVGTYSADGVILSTPTGSTAYSLSAGGPIVSPAVDCILATPICPHTLAVRPLVLSASERVTVEVLSPTEELILTMDGQEGARMIPGDRLVVSRADIPLRLVRFPGQTFFSTLRRKLRWGDLRERDRDR